MEPIKACLVERILCMTKDCTMMHVHVLSAAYAVDSLETVDPLCTKKGRTNSISVPILADSLKTDYTSVHTDSGDLW